MAENFFISYNKADKAWAAWVAWQLEAKGYTTVIQDWDFKAGNNFALEMAKAANAERTIAIFSDDYIKAEYTKPEWAAAFAQDPTGENRTLIPVRIKKCDIPALLKPVVYIDLVGKDADSALQALLQHVKAGRVKPALPPAFPGAKQNPKPEFPGMNIEMPDSNDGFSQPEQGNGESISAERKIDSANFDKHIKFQSQIRTKIEETLNKEVLKPLLEGFTQVFWKNEGKSGNPSVKQVANELFSIDPETQLADAELMLEKLLNGTDECLKQLDALGQSTLENHIVWKEAKQILGWLTTLAVRTECLEDHDKDAPFDKIDIESLMGVEIYTARQKEIPAEFRPDEREKNPHNYQGGNQIDHEFIPEAGWQTNDITEQIWLIIWMATGGKSRTIPLSETELQSLNKRLVLRRKGSKNRNYHIVVNESEEHSLWQPEICKQIKEKLPELTIIHIGTITGTESLLLMGEGELVTLIDEFLSLITDYQ